MGEEGLQKTNHNKIFVAAPMEITMVDVAEKLELLNKVLYKDVIELEDVKNTIKEVVPTFHEPEELNNEE